MRSGSQSAKNENTSLDDKFSWVFFVQFFSFFKFWYLRRPFVTFHPSGESSKLVSACLGLAINPMAIHLKQHLGVQTLPLHQHCLQNTQLQLSWECCSPSLWLLCCLTLFPRSWRHRENVAGADL